MGGDVYALGIILYELLTGVTPLGHAGSKEMPLRELLQLIRDEAPPAPSVYLSELAMLRDSSATISAKDVRGELDWIVLRALEKDPVRRYANSGELTRELERFLNDEPIEAAPGGAAYRMQKFLKRNWSALLR